VEPESLHEPSTQALLQQSESVLHSSPTIVQSVDPSHTPSAQLRLQQSVASEQGSSLV